jgi:hypothetical protein
LILDKTGKEKKRIGEALETFESQNTQRNKRNMDTEGVPKKKRRKKRLMLGNKTGSSDGRKVDGELSGGRRDVIGEK